MEFVFCVLMVGLAAVLLAIFFDGRPLYFGAGLPASMGAATMLDGIERFRFWRHHARCASCRARQAKQFAEFCGSSCGPA